MSGESVGLVVVGPVALVAFAGAAAGAGCAFVVGGGLTLVGAALERRELRRRAAAAAASAWESAALEVAVRNARIATLRTAAGSLDERIRPVVPDQLVLGDQILEDLSAWCSAVDGVLASTEQDVARLTARDLLSRIMSEPHVGGAPVRIDDLLADRQPTSAQPTSARSGLDGDEAAASVREDLVRVVARLAPDAPPVHRAAVEAAATRVADATNRVEALNWLAEVRHRVDAAEAAAERVRDDALAAALLLQPLGRSDDSVVDEAEGELRRALVDVTAGRRALEPWMRQEGVHAAERVKRTAERWYVRKAVVETLGELGYGVAVGFQTAVPVDGTLRVVRDEWSAHGVRMRLDDETGTLTAFVVRTEASAAWDAGRQDVERQRQWCASLDAMRERLRQKGVDYRISSLVEPGLHAVPLVTDRPAPSRRADDGARHLDPPGTGAP
jgi:hypothetical protein